MPAASLPVLSREYVRVPITAEGVSVPSLTALPIEFAFLATKDAAPSEGDWVSGSWEPSTSGETVAQSLIGPDPPKPLTVGLWYVWVRFTGAVERPVRSVGQIKIT